MDSEGFLERLLALDRDAVSASSLDKVKELMAIARDASTEQTRSGHQPGGQVCARLQDYAENVLRYHELKREIEARTRAEKAKHERSVRHEVVGEAAHGAPQSWHDKEAVLLPIPSSLPPPLSHPNS